MPIPIIAAAKALFTPGKAKEIVSDVMSGLDNLFTSKEEKLAKEIELTEKVNAHLLGMEQELTKQMESEDKAITERWKADMESDSWLSKNTRPLVMLSLLGFLFVIIIFDSAIKKGFEVKPEYIALMETLLVTVVVAYFSSRGVEKFKAIHESTKRK
jgi:hypothetical protein